MTSQLSQQKFIGCIAAGDHYLYFQPMNTRMDYIGSIRSRSAAFRAIAGGLLVALFAVGCSSPSHSAPAPQSSYPLPAPGAGPDSSLLPPAAADPGGTVRHAAGLLARQVAAGGRNELAALRTALARSGITLINGDGSVAAQGAAPTSGVEIPAGEMLAAADQNSYAHGLRMSQIASALAALTRDKVNVAALQRQLVTGLPAQAAAGRSHPEVPSTTAFLCAFILALGQHAAPAVTPATLAPGDEQLTGLQTWLLWLSLASGAFDNAVAVSGHRKVPTSSTLASGIAGQAGGAGRIQLLADSPCTASGTGGKILDAAANALGALAGGVPFSGWDGVTSMIGNALGGEANPGKVMDVGAWTAVASVALAMAHLAAEGFGLKGKMVLVGEPLIRTKETHSDGEEKPVKLTLSYDIGRSQWANCLRQMLNLAGTDLSLPNNGPVTDATVYWHMPNDAGGVLNNFVQFDLHGRNPGHGEVSSQTDGSGTATIDLQGIRQRYTIPPGTQPFTRYVTIVAGISTRDSNVVSDLNDAVGALVAATGGPASVAASIIPNLIDRSEMLSVTQTFKVKDWPADFKVTGRLQYTGGYSGAVSGIKCDGVAGDWVIHGGGGSMTITLNDQGVGTVPGGTAVLQEGNPAKLEIKSSDGYAENAVTVIPGSFPECHGH